MIARLPAATARRINSGQVISDVRSVVKELVENALDAGATTVRVVVGSHCGLDSVVVADNGRGIAAADRPLCAREHATSKLADYDGLATVSTYGFRGEALYAMRQCARVLTICTRTAGEPAPTELVLTPTADDASASTPADTTAGAQGLPPLAKDEAFAGFVTGTAVRVTGLWARHPVRHQYLQHAIEAQPAREIRRLVDLVQTYALARPETRFSLCFHDKGRGRPFDCGPCDGVGAAITSIFGPLLSDELEHVHFQSADETVAIDGYLPSKAAQHMIVMRKFVTCSLHHKRAHCHERVCG